MKTKMMTGFALIAGMAAAASGQIVGSGHDFSSYAWSDGEICKPCHTPHFAMAGLPRLWNHELTVANYTMHEGAGTAADDFDIVSRLCLSCHDGTVALDSFGGETGGSFIPAGANLGTDFTNDHPVGSDAQYPPDPQPSWWAGAFHETPANVRTDTWTDGSGVDHQVVGCATCHNPHNRGNHDPMLVISNSASALCLDCHIK
ncbi:MAG: cytochrome C [Phycisphaeraceae bacterium]|nr:MAG: cytochrome C [Phycisphaeraceae bacterium]